MLSKLNIKNRNKMDFINIKNQMQYSSNLVIN